MTDGDADVIERGAWSRVGPACGVLFAISFAAVLVALPNFYPDVRAHHDAEHIAAALAAETGRMQTAFTFVGLTLFFFVWFLADLRQRLESGVPAAGQWLVNVVWAGGLLYAVGLLASALALAGTFAMDDFGDDVQVAKALFALFNTGLLLWAPGAAVMMAGAAAVVLRFGALPRWLGWLALVAVLPAALTPWWPAAAVWVLVVSIVLLVRPIPEPAEPGPPAAQRRALTEEARQGGSRR